MALDFSPVGFVVVLKWFRDPFRPNNIISKSLGKYSYIDPRHDGPMPTPGTMWVCQVTHESNPTQKRGAFLVCPLREVEKDEHGNYKLAKLMPGFYSREDHGDVVVLKPDPSLGAKNWIATLPFKRALPRHYYAVFVPLAEGKTDGTTQAQGQ